MNDKEESIKNAEQIANLIQVFDFSCLMRSPEKINETLKWMKEVINNFDALIVGMDYDDPFYKSRLKEACDQVNDSLGRSISFLKKKEIWLSYIDYDQFDEF